MQRWGDKALPNIKPKGKVESEKKKKLNISLRWPQEINASNGIAPLQGPVTKACVI